MSVLTDLIYFFSILLSCFSCCDILQIFDGHNGSGAAIYSKENLLNNVLKAIPMNLSREEWISALPRALVAGFVKTDIDFQEKCRFFIFALEIKRWVQYYCNIWCIYIRCFIFFPARYSGTTVTFVIVEGWIVTVASVGDSRCILESAEGAVYFLSADHRLDVNEDE